MIFVCNEALAPYAKEYFKDSNVEVIVAKSFEMCEEKEKNNEVKND